MEKQKVAVRRENKQDKLLFLSCSRLSHAPTTYNITLTIRAPIGSRETKEAGAIGILIAGVNSVNAVDIASRLSVCHERKSIGVMYTIPAKEGQ